MKKRLSNVDYKYNFPVVSAKNIFGVVNQLGINAWKKKEQTMSLSDYLERDLSEDQKADLRFAPQSEVLFLVTPKGVPFTAFRSIGRDWVTVFVLLPGDLVPLIAEWKHGAEVISIVQPSGVPDKGETMDFCAKREFQEEAGIELTSLIPLSKEGIPVSSRQSTQRCYPYLGFPKTPIEPKPSRLDDNENLAVILMPLKELILFISSGSVTEECTISTTFLALAKLQKIDFKL